MSPNGSQSSGNCYEPYMLGSSYGTGGVASTTSCSVENRRRSCARNQTVRDCLLWQHGGGGGGSTTITPQMASWSNNSPMTMNMQNGGGMGIARNMQPQQCGPQQQPQAFVTGGDGECGGGGAVPIPIRIAPSGTDPASLMRQLEPITLKVQAPSSSGKNGGPITFTLDPAQIYGNMRMQR